MKPTIPYGMALTLIEDDVSMLRRILEDNLHKMEYYGSPPPAEREREFYQCYANVTFLILLFEEFFVPCPQMVPYWTRLGTLMDVIPSTEEL